MKRERNRGYRRQMRERAVKHAFDVYWYYWNESNEALKSHRYYYNYCRIILDHNRARWYYEDLHRDKILGWAKQNADNMCTCSCWICTRYRNYKTIHERRELERENFDIDDFLYDDM